MTNYFKRSFMHMNVYYGVSFDSGVALVIEERTDSPERTIKVCNHQWTPDEFKKASIIEGARFYDRFVGTSNDMYALLRDKSNLFPLPELAEPTPLAQ